MPIDRRPTGSADDEKPLVAAAVPVSLMALRVAWRNCHCRCLPAPIAQHHLETLAKAEEGSFHDRVHVHI
jgi:hypothetical protein